MKLLQFYLLTIFIAWDPRFPASAYFMQNELEYLATRLYPAECFQLVTYLGAIRYPEAPFTDHLNNIGNIQDTWNDKGRSRCLDKLEEWKDKSFMDQNAGNKLKLVLQKLGRPDLVAHLKKTYPNLKYEDANVIPTRKYLKLKKRDTRDSGIRDNVASLNSGRFIQVFQDGDDKNVSYILGPEFTMYVVIGCLVILSFLGCIVAMSYTRVYHYYRCYMAHFKNKDEEKCMYDEALSKLEILRQKEQRNLEICQTCTTDNEKQDKDIDHENAKRSRRYSINNENPNKTYDRCKNTGKSHNKSTKTNESTNKVSKGIQDEMKINVCKCSSPSHKPALVSILRKIIAASTKKKNSDNHTSSTLNKIENNGKSQDERNKRYRAGKTFRKKYFKRSRRSKIARSSRKVISTERINLCACKMCKLFNINDEKYKDIHKLISDGMMNSH